MCHSTVRANWKSLIVASWAEWKIKTIVILNCCPVLRYTAMNLFSWIAMCDKTWIIYNHWWGSVTGLKRNCKACPRGKCTQDGYGLVVCCWSDPNFWIPALSLHLARMLSRSVSYTESECYHAACSLHRKGWVFSMTRPRRLHLVQPVLQKVKEWNYEEKPLSYSPDFPLTKYCTVISITVCRINTFVARRMQEITFNSASNLEVWIKKF